MIVEVAFGLPVDKTFKYIIPSSFSSKKITPGVRVRAPFRSEVKIGYVVDVLKEGDREGLKEISEVLDSRPVINSDILQLTWWMAIHYYSAWGECIEASIPGLVRKGRKTVKPHKEISIKPDVNFKKPKRLTPAQERAFKTIREKFNAFNVFLLFGVTASGKTEIYLRAVELALDRGKSALVLVPEIALSPQTVSRFKNRFRNIGISVLHSGLTEAQRFQEWNKIKDGESRICIGTRSAIFAPFVNLGVIIIDEEHEISYKQDERPRYHARALAIIRGKIFNCPVILGSATPSLESYYKAKKGEYILLELPHRIKRKKLPDVKIIDLRSEKRRGLKPLVFSQPLKVEIQSLLDRKAQAMLFLNRRGFSTSLVCLKCGYVIKCPRCEISLTYHSRVKRLICHHCNYKAEKISICPQCQSRYLIYRGFGTQKVVSELHRLFPGITTARLDSDALRKRGVLEKIIQEFRDHKIDILVGTQIIAKGHDFPNVDLVGVILADLSLNIIDFRAGERTFSLLTQVAGRSGRGRRGGRVIIQTYNPEHYTIQTSLKQDYPSFYSQEIERRKILELPPFSQLIKLELRHKDQNKAEQKAYRIKELLEGFANRDFEILGPAPHPVPRLRGEYRWDLIIKSKNLASTLRLLYNIIGFRIRFEGVKLIVDVDPYED